MHKIININHEKFAVKKNLLLWLYKVLENKLQVDTQKFVYGKKNHVTVGSYKLALLYSYIWYDDCWWERVDFFEILREFTFSSAFMCGLQFHCLYRTFLVWPLFWNEVIKKNIKIEYWYLPYKIAFFWIELIKCFDQLYWIGSDLSMFKSKAYIEICLENAQNENFTIEEFLEKIQELPHFYSLFDTYITEDKKYKDMGKNEESRKLIICGELAKVCKDIWIIIGGNLFFTEIPKD